VRTIFHLQGRTDIPGVLVGEVNANCDLVFLYQHLNEQRELITARCRSTPEVLETGRYRLNEYWRWASSHYSSDRSLIEEVER
jgi:hypothetical protein